MKIQDKVIIITGAASGIGLSLAKKFREEGAGTLVVCDIDHGRIHDIAAEINGIPAVFDVTDAHGIKRIVADIEERFGRIDLFCSNAGVLEEGGIETSHDVWARAIDINFMAHVSAAQACLPGMISRRSGYFLNTVSAAGLLTEIKSLSYSVSKHAAIGFAEWLAITHGHQGIGVTVLCPMAVQTPMIDGRKNGGSAGLDGVLTPDQVADCAVTALEEERFLALPHPKVKQYFQNKVSDYDMWIQGMQRLKRKYPKG